MPSIIRTRKPIDLDWTLIGALGITPALATATTLAYGLLLTSGMVTVLVGAIAVLRISHRFVVPGMHLAYTAVVAGALTALWAMFAHALFPAQFTAVYGYAYLIPAMVPVLLTARTITPVQTRRRTAGYVLATGLLAAAILCAVAALREAIGAGTLLGYRLFPIVPFRFASTVQGGLTLAALVIAGFAAARHMFRSTPETTHVP